MLTLVASLQLAATASTTPMLRAVGRPVFSSRRHPPWGPSCAASLGPPVIKLLQKLVPDPATLP